MCRKANLKHNLRLLAILVLALWQHPNTEGATVIVTNTADTGSGSLRFAVSRAFSGDTIDLTGLSGTILLTSGHILISKSLTIVGPGPNNLAVSGNAAIRIF